MHFAAYRNIISLLRSWLVLLGSSVYIHIVPTGLQPQDQRNHQKQMDRRIKLESHFSCSLALRSVCVNYFSAGYESQTTVMPWA